ncbi:MAG: hypothetical protein HW390_2168 [Candidatus Brocadiaceae bacterium]|nr:hypothetical protein [Candidatus Brocadiaceae bacterium]
MPFALAPIPLTIFSWKEERVASVSHAAKKAKEGLRQAVKSKKLWACAAFLFLFNAMPQLGSSVLYVYETNVLNFSQVLIGYLDMTANVGFIIGGWIYEPFGFTWLIVFSTFCVAATWFLLPLFTLNLQISCNAISCN